MPGQVEITLNGARAVIDDLESTAVRLLDMRPVLESLIPEIEAESQALFDAHQGEFVRTGALEASLTATGAEGAIREVTNEYLDFGSAISYAIFQGTEPSPKGGYHRGPSAVLRDPVELQDEAERRVMEYILTGLVA